MKPARGIGQTEPIYKMSEIDKKMKKVKPKMKQLEALSKTLKK